MNLSLKFLIVVTCVFASLFIPTPQTGADESMPPGLVPMYRFYDSRYFKHIYTTSEDELATWRSDPALKEQLVIGMVSPEEIRETQRFWRSIRKINKIHQHHYYLVAPKALTDGFVDNEAFNVYVWNKPAPGRVPVFASSWIDGTDLHLDCDVKAVEKYIRDSKRSLGVNRLQYGGAKLKPMFYVYPYKEDES